MTTTNTTRSLGIIATFKGPTNSRSARIAYKFSDGNGKPTTVDFDHAATGSLSDQACAHLTGLGYDVTTIVPMGSDSYLLAIDYDCAPGMSNLGWPLK